MLDDINLCSLKSTTYYFDQMEEDWRSSHDTIDNEDNGMEDECQ